METRKANFIDIFYVLFKWRRLIVTNFVLVSVAAVIISLLMPKWYRSTAVIMPPDSKLGSLNIASMVSKLPISGLGLPLGSGESQSLMAILKSRSINETVIYKHNLIEVYDVKNIEKALRKLQGNITITLEDEGQIAVSVLDKVPVRAQAMANTYISALDSINTLLKVQKARNDRIFIEERLNQNKSMLLETEENLKTFQQQYGVFDIPEQTRAAISNAAELQSLIYAKEVELRTKQNYLSPEHFEVESTRAILTELKRKLSELKFRTSQNGKQNSTTENMFIPFEEVPERGMEYVRLLRDVQVQNAIFELLTKIYEQAKIEEAKDTPNIQILDHPNIPLYKAKPKRMIIVIIAALFSLIVSSLFVFYREYVSGLMEHDKATAEKVEWIKEQTRDDLKFVKNRSKH